MSKPAVLVTGGAARIGACIARAFADAGWHVVIHYLGSDEEARTLAGSLPSAEIIQCDLADGDAAVAMAQQLAARLPDWRVLINNAAIFPYDAATDLDPASNRSVMQVNAQTPARMAQVFLAKARAEGGRRVIHVTDQKLENPNPDFFSYTMSKHALAATIPMLAMGLAGPQAHGGLAAELVLGADQFLIRPASREEDEARLRAAGDEEELGITVALVPTHLPGVTTGRRHLPSFQMFQNGPTKGKDVFIPLDHVIGGEAQLGKGWKMLMAALAAGRGISLPSLSAAAAAFSARTTGAYARIREQFGIPVGKFEGVQERLGAIAAAAYRLDAARRLTCAGLDSGLKLAVISAIMKAHATDQMRQAVNDAMDVHAGKAVIDGPSNYLGNLYRAVPVGITVEGANILTRNLIIFGQGAIRAHPYLLKEMNALEEEDRELALTRFDKAFWAHVGHGLKTAGRAWIRNWSGGLISPSPRAGKARRYYRQLSRASAGFALLSDFALLTLGGALKRKEMLSARLGDILSELYFLSAVLKRWEDEGRQTDDLPLLAYSMEEGLATIDRRFAELFANLPNRFVAGLCKFLIQPLGPRRYGPKDKITVRCAEILMAPSATRDRLTSGLHRGRGNDAVAALERAFSLSVLTEKPRDAMRKAAIDNPETAVATGDITAAEAEQVAEYRKAVAAVVAVDDFAPGDIAFHGMGAEQRETGRPAQAARV